MHRRRWTFLICILTVHVLEFKHNKNQRAVLHYLSPLITNIFFKFYINKKKFNFEGAFFHHLDFGCLLPLCKQCYELPSCGTQYNETIYSSEQTHWLKTVYHLLNAYLTLYILYLQELYSKTDECRHQTGRVVRLWPMTTCIYGYGGWPRDKGSVRSNCKCILHGKKQRNRLYLLTEPEPRSQTAWGKTGIHCHMQFALKS